MAVYDDESNITLLDSQVPFVPTAFPPSLNKRYMNPIRFRTNYLVLPCYLVFCAACLILVLVLGGIDDQKYAPFMIGSFVLLGGATVCLLAAVPQTRKKELALELDRYDFDYSNVEEQEFYIINLEGIELRFGRNGLSVDGQFHWYGHTAPRLVTSNKFNRIWIAIRFGSEDDLTALFVPLQPVLIRAVEHLVIPLRNPEELDYLLTHKQNTFAQIYNRGTFQVFSNG